MDNVEEDVQALIAGLLSGPRFPESARQKLLKARIPTTSRGQNRRQQSEIRNILSSPAALGDGEDIKFNNGGGGQAVRARQKYTLMGEMRQRGQTWDEIADFCGYTSAKDAINAFRNYTTKYAISETVAEVRQTHHDRLEFMYASLVPSIERADAHTPRAVEVAVKVLERQGRLHAVDAMEEVSTNRGAGQQQAVVINITAHPGDERAQRLLAESQDSWGGGEMGGGQGSGELLPPSNPGLPEHKEDYLFSGRDIRGEDLVRSVLDSEKTRDTTE